MNVEFTRDQLLAYFKARHPGLELCGKDELRGPCNIHDGERDSLCIGIGEGHGPWTCYSNCGSGHIFKYEELLFGLKPDEARKSVLAFFGMEDGKQAKHEHKWRTVKEYPYTDHHGNLLFEVVRKRCDTCGQKSFNQRRPDGDGGWIWNLGPVKPVLYRLHLITDADTVALVEGERDAESLEELGFRATTAPMGADKWRPEYTETLAGKHITVFVDKDEAGQKHMAKVVKSLHGKAASVKVIFPVKGKDVTDWIEAGADRKIIEQAIATTEPWTPTAKTAATSNPELEETIISVCLRDSAAWDRAKDKLQSGDFTDSQLRRIWDAMKALDASDPVTVLAKLESTGFAVLAGGKERLDALVAKSAGTAGEIGAYCSALREFTYRRKAGKTVQEIDSLVRTGGAVSEILPKIEALSEKLKHTDIGGDKFEKLSQVVEKVGYEKFLNPLAGVKWVDTPFWELNDMIIGFFPGTLNILAARPSVGKSVLGAQMAYYAAARKGVPTAIFSAEMQSVELYRRLVAMHANVDHQKLRLGQINQDERKRVHQAMEFIESIPLWITDCGRTMHELTNEFRESTTKHNFGFLVIDHLHEMRMGGAYKTEQLRIEIGEMAKGIKSEIAKKYEIPVVLLAQLNRNIEHRQEKAPALSDLQESGSIEQAADLVMMPHRPEWNKPDGDSSKTELYIRKQRNGPTGMVKLRFIPEFQRFENKD